MHIKIFSHGQHNRAGSGGLDVRELPLLFTSSSTWENSLQLAWAAPENWP